MQPHVAVLIDLAFFIHQYRGTGRASDAASLATALHQGALRTQGSSRPNGRNNETRHELFRVFCYDARPLAGRMENPVSGRAIDFADTEVARFRCALHDELKRKRKVALRLGSLAPSQPQWIFRPQATRDLLEGRRSVEAVEEDDVALDARRRGVELRLAMDVSSLAFKTQVQRIVFVTGDAEVTPLAKLARREGIDVVLDPMGVPVSPEMAEHVDGVQGFML
ncbi:MAG: NYN domain-containing protein, partial [Halofilum sp. (in: g-proteobacteria)]